MATQKEKAAELRWEALHLLNMALAFPEDSVHDGELEKTFAKVELKLGDKPEAHGRGDLEWIQGWARNIL